MSAGARRIATGARLAALAVVGATLAGCARPSSADAAAEVVREEAAFVADSAAIAARVRLDTVLALYTGPNPDREDDPSAPAMLWRHVARDGAFCDADARRASPGDTLRCPWTTLREATMLSPFDGGFALVAQRHASPDDSLRWLRDSVRLDSLWRAGVDVPAESLARVGLLR